MGIIISLILIAVGAILAWAVNSTSGSVDVHTVGYILIVVGFLLFLLSLFLWRTWWGPGFWFGYAEPQGPVVRRRYSWPYWSRRRTTYVEEEPPPGPPY